MLEWDDLTSRSAAVLRVLFGSSGHCPGIRDPESMSLTEVDDTVQFLAAVARAQSAQDSHIYVFSEEDLIDAADPEALSPEDVDDWLEEDGVQMVLLVDQSGTEPQFVVLLT